MIAIAQRQKAKVASVRQNDLFLSMLPQIVDQAEYAFRQVRAGVREELVQETIAQAYGMFVRLCHRGKSSLAYATPLAKFAIRNVRAGRRIGSRCNSRDITSHAAADKTVVIKRLDKFDRHRGEWREALVEDRHAGPADTAAARIDCAAWLASMCRRHRVIACSLASGETTRAAARKFGISAGRISQLRRWFRENWHQFQDERAIAIDHPCAM